MKKLLFMCLGFLFFFTSCDLIFGDDSTFESTTFLIGCDGSDELQKGLYQYSLGGTPTFITEYHPWVMNSLYADYNNGVIAFNVDNVPENTSGIAYMNTDDLSDVKFAPIPSAPEDFYYSVPRSIAPRVLIDGQIAYRVKLETVNVYDDYHIGMLAIFDPKSGELEVSGDPSAFVLSQPEKGSDTEGGSMGGSFVVSPDGKYAYCKVYGYGTNWGTYHVDYNFIVKYSIGNQGLYERLVQLEATPTAATGDGNYLIVTGETPQSGYGLTKIALGSNEMIKVDEYLNDFQSGHISGNSSKMFKYWRGSGMGEYDFNQAPASFTHIIDGDKILTTNFKGLGHGAQYSEDESLIYFVGSTDYYTNYDTDVVIYSTPIKEVNETPDSVGYLTSEYCTDFFIRISD